MTPQRGQNGVFQGSGGPDSGGPAPRSRDLEVPDLRIWGLGPPKWVVWDLGNEALGHPCADGQHPTPWDRVWRMEGLYRPSIRLPPGIPCPPARGSSTATRTTQKGSQIGSFPGSRPLRSEISRVQIPGIQDLEGPAPRIWGPGTPNPGSETPIWDPLWGPIRVPPDPQIPCIQA